MKNNDDNDSHTNMIMCNATTERELRDEIRALKREVAQLRSIALMPVSEIDAKRAEEEDARPDDGVCIHTAPTAPALATIIGRSKQSVTSARNRGGTCAGLLITQGADGVWRASRPTRPVRVSKDKGRPSRAEFMRACAMVDHPHALRVIADTYGCHIETVKAWMRDDGLELRTYVAKVDTK